MSLYNKGQIRDNSYEEQLELDPVLVEGVVLYNFFLCVLILISYTLHIQWWNRF